MKKLLFVDDEPISVKGLRMLLDYEALGIEIIGACHNGEEALDFIRREQPDIVVTDIWMPLMDGIELMKAMHEQKISAKIIVLSGYHEFEYAKNALTYGATDYLLKPVEREQLESVLLKTIGLIDAERTRRHEAELVHESEPLLKRKFLEDLLKGSMDVRQVRDKARYFGLELHDTECAFMSVTADQYAHNPEFSGDEGRKRLTNAMRNTAEEIISHMNLGTTVIFENAVWIILNPSIGTLDGEAIRRTADEIRRQIQCRLGEPVHIGFGPYEDRGQQEAYVPVTDNYPKELADKILAVVENGHDVKCAELCGALWIRSGGHAPTMRRFCERLSSNLDMLIRNYGCEMDARRRPTVPLETIRSEHDFLRWLEESVAIALRAIAAQRTDDNFIALIKTYIDNNFEKKITLTNLAALVYMNPTYLSNVFKTKTGANVTDYILKIRMQKAAQLLRDTNFRTYMVAELSGYNNIGHFNKVFKEFYGVTPGEFRDRQANRSGDGF